MTYDKAGRMTSITTMTSAGKTIGKYYEYDTMGNVISYTDESGSTTYYEYDLAGQVTAIKDSQGKTTAEYTYDSMGRILQEKQLVYIILQLSLAFVSKLEHFLFSIAFNRYLCYSTHKQ